MFAIFDIDVLRTRNKAPRMRRAATRIAASALWSVLLLGSAGAAEAAIIDGQFTAEVTSGSSIVFNQDFSIQSTTPIAPATSLTGTFRIDTALLPAGVSTTTGNPATFGTIETDRSQTGGAQFLTVNATLGLAVPQSLAFRRDPVLPKPAIVAPGSVPTFVQTFNYSRGFAPDVGVARCCDFLFLGNQNGDIWSTADFRINTAYFAAFSLSLFAGLPTVFPDNDGVPGSGSFDTTAFDTVNNVDNSSGQGSFDFHVAETDFTGPQESFFNFELTGQFNLLTLSFETTDIPEPASIAFLLVLAPFVARYRQGLGDAP